MQKTKEVTRSYETTEIVSVTCDLCGMKFEGDHWNAMGYEVSETQVFLNEGERFPECSENSTKTFFDICPKCFKAKLIPWLKSQGAKPTKKESW